MICLLLAIFLASGGCLGAGFGYSLWRRKKGVELSNRIFMPLLVVLFTILVIQALRLPGAADGLNAFFTPNWKAMMDYKVWLAAYGHIFFLCLLASVLW